MKLFYETILESTRTLLLVTGASAVFSNFAAPLQDLSCGPARPDPEFLVSDTAQIFKNLAQNCAFWSSVTVAHD